MSDTGSQTDPASTRVVVVPAVSAADQAALRRLVAAYVTTWYAPGQPFAAHDMRLLATVVENHAPPSGAALLARKVGVPVGCVLLRRHPLVAGVGELRKMYTEPSAWRQGVGVALLDAADQAGHGRLVLDVAADRVEAVALYSRAGFVEMSDVATLEGFVTMVRPVGA